MAFNNNSNSKQQFSCLYTKHKTQKRKVWHDGRLVVFSGKAMLHDAHPKLGSSDPILDQCEISPGGLLAQGQMLEMDKFLVEVDGPWTAAAVAAPAAAPQPLIQTTSSSLKKIMTSKFQKPKAFVPPPQQRMSRAQAILQKRKRPLQPGEIYQMHYGSQQQDAPIHSIQQPRRVPPGYGGRGMPPIPQGMGGAPLMDRGGAPMQHQAQNNNLQQPPNNPPQFGAPPQQQRPTMFGAPQPQQQQQQQHTSSATQYDAFSNNGFNANEFYGEEEDEEQFVPPPPSSSFGAPSPSQSGSAPGSNPASTASLPRPQNPFATSAAVSSATNNNHSAAQQRPTQPKRFNLGDSDSDSEDDGNVGGGSGGPNSFPPTRSQVPPPSTNNAPNQPRSGTDMLALFGMEADDDTASQGDDSSLLGPSQTSVAEQTSNFNNGKENADNRMVKKTIEASGKADGQQQQSNAFFLAPADTSSDESSDEDN